jgi:pimeloyl-ACP methyl ester carboxylesterase
MADIKISMHEQTVIPANKNVLLIIGDKDQLTSLELARKYAEKRDVTMKIIPNSGHLINYETPKQVADRIEKYIN